MDSKTMLLTFPVLSEIPFIKHGFSTKNGGVSQGHLSSMNLSFSRGDDPKNVYENYRRICKELEVDTADLVFSDQVHDTKVHVVTKEDRAGEHLDQKKLLGIDGLITNEPGLVLTTSYADCVPLYFVDQKKKVIGLSHSGWRGTVGQIGKITIEKMHETYGTNPCDVIGVIGPSICPSCYEVSEEVANEFRRVFSSSICEEILIPNENQKFQLDLWLANFHILKSANIPASQIHITKICTCCNSDLLFSHRATKGQRGNLNGFLSLR